MRRLKLALIMMVIVTMTVFAFSSSQKANYDVIESEYLYKVDDIDQAKALAVEYDLELLDLSNYGIATYLASVT
ncbi:MAG: hypothetical protein JXB20_06315, partial [Bacilli bacterium]|nr:hypothetical protein [Bacilli bacterium]